MNKLPQATPTSATYDDYRAIYGLPLITFGLLNGLSYHWYPKRGEGSPYVVLNVFHDGTSTAAQMTPD
jgi:hypothetical protein